MTFQLRPVTPDDYPRMIELMKQELPEYPTVDELKTQDQIEGLVYRRMAAVTPDGLMVGYGNAGRAPFEKPGKFGIGVRVDKGWRGQGIGQALFQEAERFALSQHPTVLVASVREENPAYLAWAERRGFAVKYHVFESKLDLNTFDAAQFDAALTAAEQASIRFVSFAQYPQNDEWLQRFVDFFWDLALDVPGNDGTSKPTLEQFKQIFMQGPQWDPAGVLLAVDGNRWAALSMVQLQNSGGYYNGLTAVHRDYRGRGLALAVKLKAIEYVRSTGADFIRTNNHSINQRMLAVNRKMGYQPEPGLFQLEKMVGQQA